MPNHAMKPQSEEICTMSAKNRPVPMKEETKTSEPMAAVMRSAGRGTPSELVLVKKAGAWPLLPMNHRMRLAEYMLALAAEMSAMRMMKFMISAACTPPY